MDVEESETSANYTASIMQERNKALELITDINRFQQPVKIIQFSLNLPLNLILSLCMTINYRHT